MKIFKTLLSVLLYMAIVTMSMASCAPVAPAIEPDSGAETGESFQAGAIEFFIVPNQEIDNPLKDYPKDHREDTWYRRDDHVCGIVGMEAYGDIEENHAGPIMTAKMFAKEENGVRYWTPSAAFRTDGSSRWTLDVMCLDLAKAPPPATQSNGYVGGWFYEEFTPAQDQEMRTTIPAKDFVCGLVGLQTTENGDIDAYELGWNQGIIFDDAPLLKARVMENGDNWIVSADFRTHNTHESWRINTLCFDKDAGSGTPGSEYFKRAYLNVLAAEAGKWKALKPEISDSAYRCGIVGLHGRGGDIDENDDERILIAQVRTRDGKQGVIVDFNSENKHESWDVDVLCVSTDIAKDHRARELAELENQ